MVSPKVQQAMYSEVDRIPNAFFYLADIVVVTETFEEHLRWLEKIFGRISEAGLIINPEKSKFCCAEFRFLGFVIREGLQSDPEKIAPFLAYPDPRSVQQLRRFMGLSSWYRRFNPWYRRFISEFAKVLELLTRLSRLDVK